MILPICPVCEFSETEKSYSKSGYQYFSCPECFTYFLFPEPSTKVLRDFYRKSYKNEDGKINEKIIRNRAGIILKQLSEINPFGNSLLDIGSGFGFFADEAKKTGLNTLAIEPSKILSSHCSETLHVRTLNMTFEKFDRIYLNKKFDFITLIHVIEHITDPKPFLERIFTHLKNDGILFIETPNSDSHLFNFEKDDYIFLTPPDHVRLFSYKSFRDFFRNLNVSFSLTSTYSYPQHLMGILKRLINGNKARVLKKSSSVTPMNRFIETRLTKKIKFLIFDKLLARLLYRFLNIGNHGSILELYIKKN